MSITRVAIFGVLVAGAAVVAVLAFAGSGRSQSATSANYRLVAGSGAGAGFAASAGYRSYSMTGLAGPAGVATSANYRLEAGPLRELLLGLPLPRDCTVNGLADTDCDGCTDAQENGPNHLVGGQRDYTNFWDYPDMPPRDKLIRINDISYVIARYRHDQGGTVPPLYDPLADHSLLGPNLWNLGPGDGLIRINDITAVINSYRNDCA